MKLFRPQPTWMPSSSCDTKTFLVGTLRLSKGTWRFKYAHEFINQHELKPLVAFPDVRKTYEADHLWPFFMSRIPGLSQPEVMETISEEGLDDNPMLNYFDASERGLFQTPLFYKKSH